MRIDSDGVQKSGRRQASTAKHDHRCPSRGGDQQVQVTRYSLAVFSEDDNSNDHEHQKCRRHQTDNKACNISKTTVRVFQFRVGIIK